METGKIEYTRQWCKYEFSRDEMHEIAETLAIKTQELEQIESDKKAVVSRYKERTEQTQSEIKGAATRYKDGYEMRDGHKVAQYEWCRHWEERNEHVC